MKKVIMIKYGEIYLKGNNRSFFESMLLKNIRYALYKIPATAKRVRTRYFVEDYDEKDEDLIVKKLLTVFGIHSISKAVEIETNKQSILDFCENIKIENSTFKVDTNRADKTFELSSMQTNCLIGDVLFQKNPTAKVDVHNPQKTIYVDIRENGKTYIYYENIKGAGGMPVGSSADGLALLSGGIDSPVACYKIAKRGMHLTGLHFASFPYTSEKAKQKVVELAKIIKPYTHMKKLYVVSFTEIQENIHKHCKDEYMITLMRRFMMRIAERLANKIDAKAIVTGEDLGQVASQTVESITSSNSVTELLPIFRPLIAMDKEEIVEISKQIGTYNTSILPYEDCCTVFLPKYPLIKPNLKKVQEEEAKLDVELLIENAMKNIEEINIDSF
ncbi:MAG: tRNA 4-thiouridine(8) synthase ThiI [Clostridia bacterium]|nr:tRNA 4-thiouridine(8) synthase ThiI [Clostridia bacterium]